MQDKRFELTPTSDFDEFLSLMKDDRRTANIDREILKLIFDRVRVLFSCYSWTYC